MSRQIGIWTLSDLALIRHGMWEILMLDPWCKDKSTCKKRVWSIFATITFTLEIDIKVAIFPCEKVNQFVYSTDIKDIHSFLLFALHTTFQLYGLTYNGCCIIHR